MGQQPHTNGSHTLTGAPRIKITVIDYDATRYEEHETTCVEDCFPFRDTDSVTWINIDGLGDQEIIRKIGEQFSIHPLILEDIQNTGQRPTVEDLEGYIYLTLKMLQYQEKSHEIEIEHVTLIIGARYVISFQENVGDVFDPVRDRIRKDGRIRKFGSDYLAYSLIDAIVDNYFAVVEHLEERVELIEGEVTLNPTRAALGQINDLKRDMIFLRKSVWPLREVIAHLEQTDSPIIHDTIRIYLRDVYDHTIQVIDTLEIFRDLLAGMIDIYLSSLSNRLNEVMKVLTIIATIFIPLTFITGIYGMNFTYIPLLDWWYGYFMIMGIMTTIGLFMVLFFRKRGWI